MQDDKRTPTDADGAADAPGSAAPGGDGGNDAFQASGFDIDRWMQGAEPPEAFPPTPEESDEARSDIARVRTALLVRGLTLLFLLVAAPVFVAFTWSDFTYFLKVGNDPIDLGDLRALRAGGRTQLDVPDDAYVRFRNAVMTYEAESGSVGIEEKARYQYFIDPLYTIIVRTPRDLPVKDAFRSVDLPAGLVYLVEQRKAFAEDLTAGFDGEGRLLRASALTRGARYVLDTYMRGGFICNRDTDCCQPGHCAPNQTLRRCPHCVSLDDVYVFLDQERPGDAYWQPIFYGLMLLLIGAAAYFFLATVRRWRVVREIAGVA